MLSSSNEENKKESYVRLPQNQMDMAQSNERPGSEQRMSSEMSPPNSDIFVKLFSVKYWLPPEMVFAKN